MTMFYASMSIIAAAVLSFVAGAYVGIRFWLRYIRSMDKVLLLKKHRNTAGAVWFMASVRREIRGGASIDDLNKWLDAKSDEMELRGREMGPDLIEAWKSGDE